MVMICKESYDGHGTREQSMLHVFSGDTSPALEQPAKAPSQLGFSRMIRVAVFKGTLLFSQTVNDETGGNTTMFVTIKI